MKNELKHVYLIEKYLLNNDGVEKRLKVGKTKKEFHKGRLSVYETNNSPDDISLVKVVKAPEILENMFHIRFNSYRVIKKRTGRKSEWMIWKDFIREAFLSDTVFEDTYKILWENREEYLSGKDNLTVKKKILQFLEKEERIKANTIIKNLPKIDNSKIVGSILKNKLYNGMDLIKFEYENSNIS